MPAPIDADAFVKTGPASALAMFEAEAAGLEELRAAAAVRVPEVIDVGLRDGGSFLAIERLQLEPAGAATAALFGRQLAELHRCTRERHGWDRDNTIGLTPQHNPWCADWANFFGEHRLGFQLELAARNGYAATLRAPGERLLEKLPELLAGHRPAPSLLHGDLWSGNWGSVAGEPVIFDPAVHYGDRECDLAMTRLFGGFGSDFYRAYEEAWPLPPGHEIRLRLYQLYHVLNHVNLFGGGYLRQAESLLDSLV